MTECAIWNALYTLRRCPTLVGVFGENTFTWIDNVDFALLQDLANAIIRMELIFVLIGLGVIFFLVGMLFKRL